MQLFVDVLHSGPSGSERDYRGARGTSWVHPAMPTAVLTAGLFGITDGWLYHVEGGRFITAETIGEAPVLDMDTVVVVCRGDLALAEPASIDRRWQRAGGPARRAACAGMPIAARQALAAYAQ